MKVLLVSDDLLPGGAAKHVTDLANALYLNGIDVHVSAGEGAYSARLIPQIPYHPLPLMNTATQRKHIPGIIPSYGKLRKLIIDNKYDIVHSHKRFAHALVRIVLPKKCVHITSYLNAFHTKRVLNVFGDHTICCSRNVRDSIGRHDVDERTFSIIHFGISPFVPFNEEQIHNAYTQLDVRGKKKIISSVGLFAPYKDRTTLIKAIHLFTERYKNDDVVFAIQGYGEEEHSLRSLVNSLKLNDVVLFLPHSFSAEALFNISEFAVLSSKDSEGFPIVLLEAASIGKMHIGTTVGGIPEFIEHGQTGMLIQPERPGELAEMIQYLLQHPSEYQRMGANAKAKFDENFILDKMVNKILGVYFHFAKQNKQYVYH